MAHCVYPVELITRVKYPIVNTGWKNSGPSWWTGCSDYLSQVCGPSMPLAPSVPNGLMPSSSSKRLQQQQLHHQQNDKQHYHQQHHQQRRRRRSSDAIAHPLGGWTQREKRRQGLMHQMLLQHKFSNGSNKTKTENAGMLEQHRMGKQYRGTQKQDKIPLQSERPSQDEANLFMTLIQRIQGVKGNAAETESAAVPSPHRLSQPHPLPASKTVGTFSNNTGQNNTRAVDSSVAINSTTTTTTPLVLSIARSRIQAVEESVGFLHRQYLDSEVLYDWWRATRASTCARILACDTSCFMKFPVVAPWLVSCQRIPSSLAASVLTGPPA